MPKRKPTRPAQPTPADSIRQAVIAEHARAPHPTLSEAALRVHLHLHEMVERQLLDDDPSEVRRALARLQAQGLSRHEAIHAIGMVVTRQALNMMNRRVPLDREAYGQALQALDAESYRKALGRSQ